MNPILTKLNSNGNSINNIINMAKGNPQGMFNQMLKTNPQFASFVESCKGKNPMQIAQEYGLDPNLIKRFM